MTLANYTGVLNRVEEEKITNFCEWIKNNSQARKNFRLTGNSLIQRYRVAGLIFCCQLLNKLGNDIDGIFQLNRLLKKYEPYLVAL